MSQQCPNCNNKIHDNVKFCPNCGYELNEDLSQNDFEFTDDFSFTAKTDFSDDFNYDDSNESTGDDFSYDDINEATGDDFSYDESLNTDDFNDDAIKNDFINDDFNYMDTSADNNSDSEDIDLKDQWVDKFSEDFSTKSDNSTAEGEDIDLSDDFTFEEMGSSSTDLFEVNDEKPVSSDESDFSFTDDFDDSQRVDDITQHNIRDNVDDTGDFTFDDFDFTEDNFDDDLSKKAQDSPVKNMSSTQHTSGMDIADGKYLDFDTSIEAGSADDEINFRNNQIEDNVDVDDYIIYENNDKDLSDHKSNDSFTDDFTSSDFDFASNWDDSSIGDTVEYDENESYVYEEYYDDLNSSKTNDSNDIIYSKDISIDNGTDEGNIYTDLIDKADKDIVYDDSTIKNDDEFEYSDDFIIDNYNSNITQADEESNNREYASLTDMIMANKTAFLIIIIVLLVLFIIMEHL